MSRLVENGCLAIIVLPLYGLWHLLKLIGKGIFYVVFSIFYIPYVLFIEPIIDIIKGKERPSLGCIIPLCIVILCFLGIIISSKL